jgi:hypothetical protein
VAGKYENGLRTGCNACANGKYSGAGTVNNGCSNCPGGTYINTNNWNEQQSVDDCKDCDAGKSSSGTGATSCAQCGTGQYSTKGGRFLAH